MHFNDKQTNLYSYFIKVLFIQSVNWFGYSIVLFKHFSLKTNIRFR